MEMKVETSFDANGVQWAWDATSLKMAEKCPRYYQYTIIEGWQHPLKNVHLVFGGFYASAIEFFHKRRAEGADHEEALRLTVEKSMKDSFGWESADAAKNRPNLIRTIIWYIDEFQNDPLKTYILSDGKPAVELSFRLHVDDGITFCGHIDRLVLDQAEDIYPTDNKTTGSTLTPFYFEGYKPDSQMSMYAFIGKMVYSAPVKGVIVDAAQVAVGFSRFGRSPTFRTDDELNEWYDESLSFIREIQEHTKNHTLRRNPAACWGCEFRPVCSRPANLRPNFLRADFNKRKDRWDPIKPR